MKLVLNENVNKVVLSENLKYHLKNKVSIQESVFRIGSDSWCDLINEVRELHEDGAIVLNEEEQEIIDSDAGEYGLYEGEDVPLDAPFPLDDKGNYGVFCLNENGETTKVVFSEGVNNKIESFTNIKESVLTDLKKKMKHTYPKIRTELIFNHSPVNDNATLRNIIGDGYDLIGTDNFVQMVIDTDDIVPTQKFLTYGNLEATQDVGKNTNAEMVKYHGLYYLIDGHHRVANNILKNNKQIRALVYVNSAKAN